MTRGVPLKTGILILGDILAALAAIALTLLIRHGGIPEVTLVNLYTFAAPFVITLWLLGLATFGLYDLRLAKNRPAFFERLARALLFNYALAIVVFYSIPEFGLRPLLTLLIMFIMLAIFLSGWRGLYNMTLARRAQERVLFLGTTPEVEALASFIAENPQLGFIPVAPGERGTDPAARRGGDLGGTIRDQRVERIVVAHDLSQRPDLVRSLFRIVPLGVAVTDFPSFYEAVMGKIPVSLISEAWFLENLIGQRRPGYEFAKRILDLTVALVLGVVAVALLPLIALATILATPREVLGYKKLRAHAGDGIIFFRQARVGRGGTPFGLMKLRTMRLGAERRGGEKDGGDTRVTLVGNVLRKTYLDELPQLWNIVKGEMSFVGPRPERPEFIAGLEEKIPFYRMRELILPGITGWAQINMAYDASVEDAMEKLTYDLYYIKNRSIFLDLSIMLKTALKLLQRSGR